MALRPRAPSTYYLSLLRSGYAPVNGFEMYYEIHGTGVPGAGKPPLVTIHPAWGLANVFPSLARNRQLIAVELQGHGRSTDVDRPLSYEQEAELFRQMLEAFQLIPNAQLAIIPDAGHFVLRDAPEKVLPIVATFFDQP